MNISALASLPSSFSAFIKHACLGILLCLGASAPMHACTRVLYIAEDGTVIVGRSMDWGEDMHSNMWILPRGMQRDGMGGKNSATWVSAYGSVIVSGYDIGTSEGMNEKGLVVNMLALVESDYGTVTEGGKAISISTWAQYILDRHSTVAEAVADLQAESFRVQTVILPTGRPANMHLCISDASGDSAILEYVRGKLVVHHGKLFRVVTNSPTYDQQLAIMEYWKDAGGLQKSLPGTSRAADRFVRASFLLDALPKVASSKYLSGTPQQQFAFQAPMAVLSLVRSVGTPLGLTQEDQPWVSSTIWRTISDSTHRVIIFDSAMAPTTFWVAFDELDFSAGAPVKKLTLAGGKIYNGNASNQFIPAPLFKFAPLGASEAGQPGH